MKNDNLDLAIIYSYDKLKRLPDKFIVARDFKGWAWLLSLYYKSYFVNHIISKN